jgi:hypothetical protein
MITENGIFAIAGKNIPTLSLHVHFYRQKKVLCDIMSYQLFPLIRHGIEDYFKVKSFLIFKIRL